VQDDGINELCERGFETEEKKKLRGEGRIEGKERVGKREVRAEHDRLVSKGGCNPLQDRRRRETRWALCNSFRDIGSMCRGRGRSEERE